MKQLLVAAGLAALAAPSLAHARDVTMRVQDVPLGVRALTSAPRATQFNLLGLHWIGGGRIEYRTRAGHGAWRAWHTADSDNSSGAWHDGNLDWTGTSSRVQFRTRGTVRRLRSYELWSRVTTAPPRQLSQAGTPAIVSRAAWGAEEEIVRARPLIASTLKLAIVHHTAGTNSYTRAQSAAIVRGIEVYHVQGNGWNDIGYNFLVDRYGTVYEGRGGGIEKNVIGAHAGGFNAGTTGVALIGNYGSAVPPRVQQAALVDLVAWRLDLAHVDPMGTVVYTSGGNAKYRAGKLLTLHVVSGHRDTGFTECPGSRAYALLPSLRKRIAATGLPKLYGPAVLGTLGGPIRFQARLSSALPWTVTVVDRLGKLVAKGAGQGAFVDWTWRSQLSGAGRFTWTIAAPGIRVATGTLGAGPGLPVPPAQKLSLTNLSAKPAVIAPASDGTGSVTTVGFTLGAPARVTAQVLDASGVPLVTVLDEQRAAGSNTFTWAGAELADGRYRLVVTATAGGKSITKAADLTVDRTLTGLTASLPAISPNGDGVNDTIGFSFQLTQNVPLRLDIEQQGAVVATPFQGMLGTGAHTLDWDGTWNGALLADGSYVAMITVTDQLGDVQLPLPLVIDTTAPVLTLLDARTLKFNLDEPATVTLLVNQKTRIVQPAPKGTFTVPFSGAVVTVSGQAQDAAGNLSATVGG